MYIHQLSRLVLSLSVGSHNIVLSTRGEHTSRCKMDLGTGLNRAVPQTRLAGALQCGSHCQHTHFTGKREALREAKREQADVP